MHFASILVAAISLASAVRAIPTIDVVGNKFFYNNNGSQFYIQGVAYQQDTSGITSDSKFKDPLADEDSCRRDIPYLQQLHTNTIRVYALNASESHDACMKLLEDAGIYVIADLASPEESIITTSPAWTLDLYDRYTSIIDEMQQYDNVLGFFAGNEVITNSSNTDAAPFVKAAIRDMKKYLTDQGYRSIPVGYSANDDSKTRVASADYFSCGDDDVKSDFYGINMYEWCGSSSFSASGYKDRTSEFANLSIPAFFSEYGCNEVQPRKFSEVGTLYGDQMTDVWSGGIVYMYFEEANNYGLVSVDGSNISTLADFGNLRSQLGSITPSIASASEASASATSLACPATGSNWKAATNLPPTPEKVVCDCMEASLGCVVSDNVDSSDYGDLFGTVCGLIDCGDISADGSKGSFGVFSFCSSKERLSYVLNKYYEDNGSHSSDCDFSGSASVARPSTGSTCSSVLSVASASGTLASSSAHGARASDSSASSSSSSAASGPVAAVNMLYVYLSSFLVIMAAGSASIVFM